MGLDEMGIDKMGINRLSEDNYITDRKWWTRLIRSLDMVP